MPSLLKNRGFLIGAGIFLIASVLALNLGYFRTREKMEDTYSSTLAMAIEDSVRDYVKVNEKFPGTTNEEIFTALRGDRALAQDYIGVRPFIEKNGVLVDTWGHPFQITMGSNDKPSAVSPGKNGKIGDKDDVTSKEAKKTARLLNEE